MIRLFSVLLLGAALVVGSVSAQEGEVDNSAATQPSAQEAQPEPEAIAFDPEPFIESMISLRSTGLTCDQFVGNSPAQRTEGVVGYFQAIGQNLPNLVDEETRSSLSRFIGSQAAMLCQEMLDAAFADYQQKAADYEANRPEEWPVAPAANPAPWCGADYCLDR